MKIPKVGEFMSNRDFKPLNRRTKVLNSDYLVIEVIGNKLTKDKIFQQQNKIRDIYLEVFNHVTMQKFDIITIHVQYNKVTLLINPSISRLGGSNFNKFISSLSSVITSRYINVSNSIFKDLEVTFKLNVYNYAKMKCAFIRFAESMMNANIVAKKHWLMNYASKKSLKKQPLSVIIDDVYEHKGVKFEDIEKSFQFGHIVKIETFDSPISEVKNGLIIKRIKNKPRDFVFNDINSMSIKDLFKIFISTKIRKIN